MKRSKFTRKFNFVVSLCVCLAMLFSLAPAVELEAYGASDSLTSTIGVYWVAGHEITTDETDTYIYDDALLTGDSLEYNRSLATMTYELAIASMSSDREPKTAAGYANKSRNLVEVPLDCLQVSDDVQVDRVVHIGGLADTDCVVPCNLIEDELTLCLFLLVFSQVLGILQFRNGDNFKRHIMTDALHIVVDASYEVLIDRFTYLNE